MSEPNKAHDRKVETVAKLIADHVGHGMREKCMSIAEQLVRALAASEPVIYRPHGGECHGPGWCEQCSKAVGCCFAGDRATVECVNNCPCPQHPKSARHAPLPHPPTAATPDEAFVE